MMELARSTIPVLSFLEALRSPWLEKLFLLITYLASVPVAAAVILLLLWCIDKRKGYYALIVCALGTVVTQVLKLCFMMPRPWLLAPDLVHAAESALRTATDYSFPSGHTAISVGLYGSIAITSKTKWKRILFACPMVLVPFSRMLLGVHTPIDVAFAAVLAVVLLAAFRPWYENGSDTLPSIVFLAATFVCLLAALLMRSRIVPGDDDPSQLRESWKNLWMLAGALPGLGSLSEVDRRYTHYDTHAVWYMQIVKIGGGLVFALGLTAILKPVFNVSGPINAIRYAIVIGVPGSIWPMTFGRFSAMGT